jgi:hypothetical protein
MDKISNEEYYNLFCQWQDSGLSKAGFAAREGISKTSFYYWTRKFGSQAVTPATPPGFSLVSLTPVSSSAPVARISYPSGVSIEFFGHPDTDTLKRLLV